MALYFRRHPTSLIITADADDLVAGTGTGTGTGVTETGDDLPMDTVIALADEAEIVRNVFHKETREILCLGRIRRLGSYAQTLALTARNGGCTFPGCSKLPKWRQRHHILDWIQRRTDQPAASHPALCVPPLPIRPARLDRRIPRRPGLEATTQGHHPDQKPILNTRHHGTPIIT